MNFSWFEYFNDEMKKRESSVKLSSDLGPRKNSPDAFSKRGPREVRNNVMSGLSGCAPSR
jgi:hypothetical protein